MTLTTSVVICAYTEDRWLHLLAAVASVRAQLTPIDEIVVVIDHDDRLLSRASAALPGVRVLASQDRKDSPAPATPARPPRRERS